MTAPRALLVLGAIWTIAGPGVGIASAGPTKAYRSSEPVPCHYARGCRQMRKNATMHAKRWCQAEGGVERGASPTDYTCRQSDIQCIITGKIECKGRLDPTKGPGGQQGGSGSPSKQKTCLNEDCNRYIDHARGHQEQGTHACMKGFAMVGLSGMGDEIVCETLQSPVLETLVDEDTMRVKMHACPTGWYMRGVSDDRALLLCSRIGRSMAAERVQDEAEQLGMQVCDPRDEKPAFLTGIDGARQGILCAQPK
jgi:hypothetical protein